jgi:hypothetical protein
MVAPSGAPWRAPFVLSRGSHPVGTPPFPPPGFGPLLHEASGRHDHLSSHDRFSSQAARLPRRAKQLVVGRAVSAAIALLARLIGLMFKEDPERGLVGLSRGAPKRKRGRAPGPPPAPAGPPAAPPPTPP